MCLVLFALGMHPRYPLIVASNRDEYHNRPAAPIHRWKDYPNIIAGRDLEQSGTWMGVTESGRWAIVTNFREQKTTSNRKESRGNLTKNFLTQVLVSLKALETCCFNLSPAAIRLCVYGLTSF